eukprot:TRINITY_DN10924_c0_g2_i1.p1 TRINITY_DN10924_c0_g2~~TRINITY_DN10924_c0_g2_i1.p1  ORF type:complete len:103 (-),score=9.44 TRINITY_DN10924_c0_g2_i1:394-702(-)
MKICSEPASLIGCTFSSSMCQTLQTHYYEYLFHFCRQYPPTTGRPKVKEQQIHSMGKAVVLDYKSRWEFHFTFSKMVNTFNGIQCIKFKGKFFQQTFLHMDG